MILEHYVNQLNLLDSSYNDSLIENELKKH